MAAASEVPTPEAAPARRATWATISIVLCAVGYGQVFIARNCDEMACLGSGLLVALIVVVCVFLGFVAACVAAARGERPGRVRFAFLLSVGIPVLLFLWSNVFNGR
jgi:hypothetical protein